MSGGGEAAADGVAEVVKDVLPKRWSTQRWQTRQHELSGRARPGPHHAERQPKVKISRFDNVRDRMTQTLEDVVKNPRPRRKWSGRLRDCCAAWRTVFPIRRPLPTARS